MAKHTIDGDLVRTLAALLDETQLSEIEYDHGGLRIRVARQGPAVAVAPAALATPAQTAATTAAAANDPATHPGALKSPMVGVVYSAPEPGAPRFFSVGERVTEGQTLLLIEAMKTFNPIRAPKAGTVISLLVQDGQPVEFGEPLLIIE